MTVLLENMENQGTPYTHLLMASELLDWVVLMARIAGRWLFGYFSERIRQKKEPISVEILLAAQLQVFKNCKLTPDQVLRFSNDDWDYSTLTALIARLKPDDPFRLLWSKAERPIIDYLFGNLRMTRNTFMGHSRYSKWRKLEDESEEGKKVGDEVGVVEIEDNMDVQGDEAEGNDGSEPKLFILKRIGEVLGQYTIGLAGCSSDPYLQLLETSIWKRIELHMAAAEAMCSRGQDPNALPEFPAFFEADELSEEPGTRKRRLSTSLPFATQSDGPLRKRRKSLGGIPVGETEDEPVPAEPVIKPALDGGHRSAVKEVMAKVKRIKDRLGPERVKAIVKMLSDPAKVPVLEGVFEGIDEEIDVEVLDYTLDGLGD
ncbi:hypothetical protein HK097_011397 [Rhizophlyctis rosea]|uniref:Uncharacterized protein n=1 Tax=Rhizophlyctis rosea TaxID=64517 RepID=A0AAD5S9G9_9FUNG|nr:hypothetical protein HK097_011397 [Rhizophlyctis rosea]